MGPMASSAEMAVEGREGAQEEAPARLREAEEADPRSLPRRQGRFRLRSPGHPLLHGPLRVRLQGSLKSPKSLFSLPIENLMPFYVF